MTDNHSLLFDRWLSRRELLRGLAVAGGAALAGPAIAACAPTPTAPSGAPAPGGADAPIASRITIGIPVFPASPDPHLLQGGQFIEVTNAVFDGLTTMQGDRLVPQAAESWRTTDNVTWEFRLRPNIKFSNGEDLNAEAVVYSWRRGTQRGAPMGSFLRIAPAVASMEVVDPLTVRVVARNPDALIPGRLVDMRIVPPRYTEQVGDEGFARAPIGSGPYRLAEFSQNNFARLEAWPESWRGASKTREWVFRLIPEPSTRAAAIRSGEVDIISDLPFDGVASVRANPDLRLVPADESTVISVTLLPVFPDTPFADLRVRQAVRHSLNKRLVTDNLFSGLQKPAGAQFVPAGVFGHDPNLQDLPFDLNRARQLMAEAGFANGFETRLSTNAGINFVGNVAQFVADSVRQIGIRAELDILEPGIYQQRFQNDQLGPFQIILSSTTPLLDADLTLPFWMSTSRPRRFNSEEFDRTLIQSRNQTDTEARRRLLQRCVNIIAEQSAVAPLYQTSVLFVTTNRIRDFSKALSFGINIQGVTKLA